MFAQDLKLWDELSSQNKRINLNYKLMFLSNEFSAPSKMDIVCSFNIQFIISSI